jgi:hypothetical protein
MVQVMVQWRDLVGNEPSGSIKRREFIDQLRDYQLLKENPAPSC